MTYRNKAEIIYPCRWSYRVIGSDESVISATIHTVLRSMRYEISPGNQSREGKYVSVNVDVDVASESERNTVFSLLKEIATVKIVF